MVPGSFIREGFEASHRIPLMNRVPQLAKEAEEYIWLTYKYKVSTPERNEIRKKVTRMFKTTNLLELYKDFYAWLGKPQLFKLASKSKLEYADVFPLLYLKIRLEGVKGYEAVKHLLIDEMQDYTPVQYAVLSRLFS
jgi:DNA helicase II / ATP-dependent DNA helicase PcrA